jgi:hypothetical protein
MDFSFDAKFSRLCEWVHLAAWFLICFLAAARLCSVFVFTPRELGVSLVFFLQTTHQGLIFAVDFCFPLLRIFCSVVLLLSSIYLCCRSRS